MQKIVLYEPFLAANIAWLMNITPASSCVSFRSCILMCTRMCISSGVKFEPYFQKIRIHSRVKSYLNLKATTILANTLVSSKLDYCNSPLSSTTNKELHRRQLAKNALCRVVCKLSWRSHVSYHMKSFALAASKVQN